MAHAAAKNDFLGMDRSMQGPLVASGLFHLLVILLATFGLPFVIREPMPISTPISVEIVSIDKITQTNKIAAPIKKEDDKEPPKPEKPAPPQMTQAPTQDTVAPPIPAPKIEKPDEKLVKPAPKKPKPPEPKKEEKPQKDFASLLKNLTPDVKKTDEPQKDIKDVLANVTEDAQPAPIGERMTMSEEDALRRQLALCWNVLSGAKYAEDLVVEIRVAVNPDRTLQQATIINQGLYNSDSHFKAAADAAMRALRNPKCSPLELPLGKYDQWKSTVITFDPREML